MRLKTEVPSPYDLVVGGRLNPSSLKHVGRCSTFDSEPEVLVSIPVWPPTFISPSADSRSAVVRYWQKCVHEVLVNRLGGLSLPRESVVMLTDSADMPIAVYRGRKTIIQQQHQQHFLITHLLGRSVGRKCICFESESFRK